MWVKHWKQYTAEIISSVFASLLSQVMPDKYHSYRMLPRIPSRCPPELQQSQNIQNLAPGESWADCRYSLVAPLSRWSWDHCEKRDIQNEIRKKALAWLSSSSSPLSFSLPPFLPLFFPFWKSMPEINTTELNVTNKAKLNYLYRQVMFSWQLK